MEYYVLCMLDNEAVLATSKSFDNINDAISYSWYIHPEQDFIFNQNDTIYFNFIDGIYIIDEIGSTKISDIPDISSYKFLYNNEFHLITKEATDYKIYRFRSTGLELIDTMYDVDNNLVVNSVNNYLVIKDTSINEILVYPNMVYEIPESMMNFPVLSVNEDRIFIGNNQNSLLLEAGISADEFSYYSIDNNQDIKLVQSNDFLFEIYQYEFNDSTLLYNGFPFTTTYSYDLKDVSIPFEFVDESYDKKEYSLNRDLIQKNDILYSLFYKTINYSNNKIYVEISEVKEVTKSFDLGFVTDFSKESFLVVMIISIVFSGNVVLKNRNKEDIE